MPASPRTRATLITATRALLGLGSLVWLVFGVALLAGVLDIGNVERTIVVVIGILMLANGALLGVLAWAVLRGHRIVDWAAVFVVTANMLASIADEIGAWDAVAFAFNLAMLVVLLVSMRVQPAAEDR